jgi:hypothetical protein
MMKNLIIILLSFLTGNAFCESIDTIPSKSEIIDVTVFFSGAQITRNIDLNLSKGKHLVLLNELPREISPQSIQVDGIDNCTILSVKHQLDYQSESKKDSTELHIENSIKSQEQKIKALKNRLNVYDLEEKLLLDNSILGGKEGCTTISEIKEAADFYRMRLNEIRIGKLEMFAELDEANKNMQELYVQLNEVVVNTRKIYNEVLITLDCKQALKDVMKLSYFVPSAGWEPLYDFRMDEISKPLTIVYNSNVYQSSGEDWKDVNIKLSTNNPTLSGEKPELHKRYLGQRNIYQKGLPEKGSGAIKGRVYDAETNEPIPFANVALFLGQELITGSTSGFDGAYSIKPIQSGNYIIRASFIGYQTIEFTNIPIHPYQITFQDIGLQQSGVQLDAVEVVHYKVPLIEKDKTTSGATVTAEEILKMPNRSASSVATSVGGVYAGGSDYGSIRGGRDEGTDYYFDGIEISDQIETSNYISNSLSTTATSIEYDIEIPYSIPSDGNDYLIKMKEVSLPVDYVYYAIPKLDRDVFLTAEIKDWTKLNLLSGKASIYIHGTYIGESFINANQADDTLSISLGRDKNIIVKREGNKEMFDKRIIGNNIKEVLGWDITIKNNKGTRVKIIVEDQFPLSQKKSIEVERLETSNAHVDDKTGKLTWRFELGPNEKKVVNYKYSVKYPKYVNLMLE